MDINLSDEHINNVVKNLLSLPKPISYKDKLKNNPQEVIIKPEILDSSKLQEGEGSKEYRPKTWDEYIGQQNAKEKVQSYIKGCKEYKEIYPHTFLSASAGMGKTLFSVILANQLNKKIVITTGGELKTEQIFVDKLVECDGGILFIDEANRINKRVGFFILPILEQFEIHGKNIKPFTAIFATTHLGDLSKDLDALIQRCDLITLEPYKKEELISILKQYNKKQYPSKLIEENIYEEIVKNCRQTPRMAKNLLRAYVYVGNWNKVLENNNIITNGLTQNDIRVLKYLSSLKNGAGKDSIAKFLRVKTQTYEWDIEGYLIHKEYIEIGAKRKITDKGREFLNELK